MNNENGASNVLVWKTYLVKNVESIAIRHCFWSNVIHASYKLKYNIKTHCLNLCSEGYDEVGWFFVALML